MKPPRFDYSAPTTISDAVAELSRHHGEARPLAGGQTLVPMLNFRLTAPTMLVSLARIAGLSGITITPTHVRVCAMVRTARLLERDVEAACPVLSAAARLVAHPQIRNRGTVGGSIANADPAAELPAVALLTGASIRLAGPGGERAITAASFFDGMFTTDCASDEIVTAVDFPRPRREAGWGFIEFARRPGDFALAGVGALIELQDGFVSSSVVVLFGVGPKAVRSASAEKTLLGESPSARTLSTARDALEQEIVSDDTMCGSAAYRRRIAGVLFERVVAGAVSRASGARGG